MRSKNRMSCRVEHSGISISDFRERLRFLASLGMTLGLCEIFNAQVLNSRIFRRHSDGLMMSIGILKQWISIERCKNLKFVYPITLIYPNYPENEIKILIATKSNEV